MDNVKDLAYTTLASAVLVGDTTITVGDATVFPTPPFEVTVYNKLKNAGEAKIDGEAEIMLVTGIATNTLTVTRAQGGTTAIAIPTVTNFVVVQGAGSRILGQLVPKTDIIDTLVSTATDQPLSANQGKQLNEKLPIPIDYLFIGGGGGGGRNSGNGGGGGGAGQYRESFIEIILGREYDVEIGAGGTGTATEGNKGSSSLFANLISLGGGGGGRINRPPTGGNGGGGGEGEKPAGVGISGNDGGVGGPSSGNFRGGGGGGASESGQAGADGGNGGAGKTSSITGTAVTRAGGGGAGSFDGTPSSGGAGGGGVGSTTTGGNGTANTGSGGGGGASTSGGDGGSGVVILRYPDTLAITLGAGLTGSTDTDGAFKVTTITAGTGTVEFNLA